MLAADVHPLPYVSCAIAQIARFGRRADGTTLMVPANAATADVTRVVAVAAAHNVALDVVTDADVASHFAHRRLLIAERLPHLDDVLYLDVNLLIRAPLDELLAWDLRYPLAAVPELGGNGIPLFGAAKVPYFNAAVLRMSLDRMRREQTRDQALEVLQRHPGLSAQDVLNLLFTGRFDNLPFAFNVPESYLERYPELAPMQDPVIVRFDGSAEPWHSSARSPLAREWRRQRAQAGLLIADGTDAADSTPPTLGAPARLVGMVDPARKVLPPRVKQSVKSAAVRVLDSAVCQLDELRTAINTGRPAQREVAPAAILSEQSRKVTADMAADRGLDLLVSVERSGTSALGRALRSGRTDVNFLSEVYYGEQSDSLAAAAVAARFPWFLASATTKRAEFAPAQRTVADRAFAATMSEHAVDFTHALLEGRPGRTLIKIFPEHLQPGAFEEMLRVFRPRLLFLRRDMIFTYASRLRAVRTRSWVHSDSTDVPYTIHDRGACNFVMKCDAWFDRVANLAAELQLDCASLTYQGLFTTGADVSTLNSFYPGPPLALDPVTGGLQSELTIQDRRTDASVRDMITAVNGLSPATQAGLLRLPGHSVYWRSGT